MSRRPSSQLCGQALRPWVNGDLRGEHISRCVTRASLQRSIVSSPSNPGGKQEEDRGMVEHGKPRSHDIDDSIRRPVEPWSLQHTRLPSTHGWPSWPAMPSNLESPRQR